ncbi:hypothetical protein ONZ45_g12275 [Pleurotus djamor]|nr:hypothetical protein ONZ45_g12275 [Pleurotus djamor]
MLVVAFVSLLGAMVCLYILFKKALSQGRPQVVGYEATVTTTLLPFEFVVILVLLSVKPNERAAQAVASLLLAVEVLVYVKCVLWGSYAVFLLVVATTVSLKFDRHIWYRDIDASPSPFPPSVVLSALFPCWFSDPLPPSSSAFEQDALREESNATVHICSLGCSCTSKQLLPCTTDMSSLATLSSTATNDDANSLSSKLLGDADLPRHQVAGSSSLSRSLVRIPNDYERRCSIEIAL